MNYWSVAAILASLLAIQQVRAEEGKKDEQTSEGGQSEMVSGEFCSEYPQLKLCQLRGVLEEAMEELDYLTDSLMANKIAPQEEIQKRKSAFVRFGKRKSAFVRFGRSGLGMKRKSAFVRFGRRSPEVDQKRKSSYIRFGKK